MKEKQLEVPEWIVKMHATRVEKFEPPCRLSNLPRLRKTNEKERNKKHNLYTKVAN